MTQYISPFLWPTINVYKASTFDEEKDEINKPVSYGYLPLNDHITSMFAAVRSFLMAYGAIYYLSPMIQPKGAYPAFNNIASEYEMSWMLPMLVRNLLAQFIIAGFWDWLLYFSPLKEKFAPFKMNPKYPSNKQIFHDMFWTTSATITGTMIEIFLCYGYCNDYFPAFEENFFQEEQLYSNLAWAMLITHWRIPHFYLIHRMMHPWKTKKIPDIGKFLYKHVHSLHHKSYNPTAFSGTSMHPVESTLYYSACFIAVPFGCHPAIVLGCIIDCGVGAWLGHDGFGSPGSGDYFHYLHHAHFDCNYGAEHVPMDRLFGTHAGVKGGLKRIWKNEKVGSYGEKGNDTAVHDGEERKKKD